MLKRLATWSVTYDNLYKLCSQVYKYMRHFIRLGIARLYSSKHIYLAKKTIVDLKLFFGICNLSIPKLYLYLVKILALGLNNCASGSRNVSKAKYQGLLNNSGHSVVYAEYFSGKSILFSSYYVLSWLITTIFSLKGRLAYQVVQLTALPLFLESGSEQDYKTMVCVENFYNCLWLEGFYSLLSDSTKPFSVVITVVGGEYKLHVSSSRFCAVRIFKLCFSAILFSQVHLTRTGIIHGIRPFSF
ncbi:hypothetical protein J3Q64DRAFT_1700596 [Phycomyces blakesleeanus]|uniref:Uncharacterized protein n=1 Tax=Phycomyces blakesleeanus TaxID=4837 RepID=A0ABR3AV73_PHYBL